MKVNAMMMPCIEIVNTFSISVNMCSKMCLPLVMAIVNCLQHIHHVGTLHALAVFHQNLSVYSFIYMMAFDHTIQLQYWHLPFHSD